MVFLAELQACFGMFGEIGVEGFASGHGAAVVGDDFFESFEAPIVHVGGGEGEVAEAGGGKGGCGFFEGGGETVVVKLVVGEVGSAVAVEAVGSVLLASGFVFGEEKLPPAFFSRVELGFAGHRAVEFGVVAGEGEEEVFESESELFRGDFAGAEGFFEGGVLGLFEMGDGGGEVGGHFTVVLDWLEDLVAEGLGAAIPEKGGLPGEIEKGHGVTGSKVAFDSFGKGETIGKGAFGVVAGGA